MTMEETLTIVTTSATHVYYIITYVHNIIRLCYAQKTSTTTVVDTGLHIHVILYR